MTSIFVLFQKKIILFLAILFSFNLKSGQLDSNQAIAFSTLTTLANRVNINAINRFRLIRLRLGTPLAQLPVHYNQPFHDDQPSKLEIVVTYSVILIGGAIAATIASNLKKIILNKLHSWIDPLLFHELSYASNLHEEALTQEETYIIKEFVDQNENVNGVFTENVRPLHRAVLANNLLALKILLKYGAIPDVQTIAGITPLHLAAQMNLPSMVQELIAYKANVNILAEHGISPLHLAAERGNIDIIEKLIECGAKVNLLDENNETPLNWARRNNHLAAAQCIATHGSNSAFKEAQEHYKREIL